MKKSISTKILIVMALLFCFVLALVLPIFSAMPTLCAPLTAKAEETVDVSKLERTDGNYEWKNGASISWSDKADEYFREMRFRFEISNPDIFHLTDTRSKEADDWATYEFTIYRESANGATPIYQIGILSYYNIFYVGHKRVAFKNTEADSTFRPGEIRFMPDMQKSDKAKIVVNSENVSSVSKVERNLYEAAKTVMKEKIDYTLDYLVFMGESNGLPFFAGEENGVKYLDVVVKVNSPITNYFVTAKSQIRWFEKTVEVKKDTFFSSITGSLFSWMFKETVQKEIYTGEQYDSLIKSPTRSVKGVLESIYSGGTFEEEITTEKARESALNILNNTSKQNVQVSYFEQIGETPFARKVTKTVNVPVLNNTIFYDDVSAALGGATLNCLGASVNGFTRDTYGNYTAEYLSSVRVEAKTVDGNRTDYFLGLGKTFKEFYSEIESEGAFNDGLYKYMLNDIKAKFPAVANYTETTLYGLWGYVCVPKTTTFNSLFKDIFQTPTEWSGSFFDYAIEGNLSAATYTALLNEHGYSWLETIWQTVITGTTNAFNLPATHYLFYANPKISEINIGENGGELGDESGAVIEKIAEIAKEAIDGANKATEEASRTVRMLIATALIITAGFGIAYGIIRLKKYNNE